MNFFKHPVGTISLISRPIVPTLAPWLKLNQFFWHFLGSLYVQGDHKNGYLIIDVKIQKNYTKTSSTISNKNTENLSFWLDILPILIKNDIFLTLEIIFSIAGYYLKNVYVF